jgi:hypothetical protein
MKGEGKANKRDEQGDKDVFHDENISLSKIQAI